jgi:hypothetical protein
LVEHDVEAGVSEGAAHRQFIAAIDAHARDALAEGVGRIAARRDGHTVAGLQEALHQQAADEAGAANHQYVLAHEDSLRFLHGVSVVNPLYFPFVLAIVQTRKITHMTKKNLCWSAA